MHQQFYQKILANFGFEPTPIQKEVIGELTDFTFSNIKKLTYLLKGYAGTGKTSIIGAMVKTLPEFNITTILLAPTGRAAKVLSGYSGQPAFTIHKMIYQLKSGGDGYTRFSIRDNKFKNAIFFVDEASMIGNGSGLTKSSWGEQKSLLDDLLEYVFAGQNCKLILIGDTAQLPPVGMEISPAVDEDNLYKSYYLNLEFKELTQVVRQDEDSEILSLATHLRNKILLNKIELPLFPEIHNREVKVTSGYDLEDELDSAYGKYGNENVMVLCRSNKSANGYNLQIRGRIKWMEEELATGDYLMVVKNNYYWLDDSSKAGFIANGDMAEIMKIKGEEEKYGFRFVNLTLRLIDYPNESELEVKVLPETLLVEAPNIPSDRFFKLYEAVSEEYSFEPNKKKRNELIRKNPYYQALQVKFAYAVTCHKSQGGQWDAVFVDQGYLTEEMINIEYLRWLYTAVTRAKKELHLVNFNEQFFTDKL